MSFNGDQIYVFIWSTGEFGTQYIMCSLLSCHYAWHAGLITLCDRLMWHWPFAWLVACLPPSPRVYLSSRYHRHPTVNSVGPRCYVTTTGSTLTHVKVVENEDLIHSTTSPAPLPPSLPLSAWDQSIAWAIFAPWCSGHSPHDVERDRSRDKAAIWQPNSGFVFAVKLKDESRGQTESRDCGAKVSSALI